MAIWHEWLKGNLTGDSKKRIKAFMDLTFMLLWAMVQLLLVLYLIRQNRNYKKAREEYQECWDLECKRVFDIPKELRKVKRSKILEMTDIICADLNLPSVCFIKTGFHKCGRGYCGLYKWNADFTTSISINGIFRFSTVTLVHEIAHHHSVYHDFNFNHDKRFLNSENEVFNSLKKLIDYGIIRY